MTSPKQRLYEEDLADLDDDYNFENDNVNDQDYLDDNEDYNDNDETPAAITTIEIVRLPERGITAWLAHLQRKERRESLLDKLRSILF